MAHARRPINITHSRLGSQPLSLLCARARSTRARAPEVRSSSALITSDRRVMVARSPIKWRERESARAQFARDRMNFLLVKSSDAYAMRPPQCYSISACHCSRARALVKHAANNEPDCGYLLMRSPPTRIHIYIYIMRAR